MNNYEDRELAREIRALGAQIPVPAVGLRARGPRASRLFTLGGVAAAVVLALVIGSTITYLRATRDNGAAGTALPSATATAPSTSPTASPSASAAPLAFPDVTLFAGSSSGLLYRITGGQVVGAGVPVCENGRSILAIRPAPSGDAVLVICLASTGGRAVLVDVSTMTVRGSQPVVERDDVAAWSPDSQQVALLQFGTCDPQAPVCSVHVALWDVTRGTTRVIKPDEVLTRNVRWTSVGLSVSRPQFADAGTVVWNGQSWTAYSARDLWIADAAGSAVLVEAPVGSTDGRVWRRTSGQEQLLTGAGQTGWPLGLDGERTIVSVAQAPGGPVIVYRGQQVERTVPTPGLCLAAQAWDRWLICTNSGSAALAFSLDANAFAQMPIGGLPSFTALAALPKR